MEQGRAVTGEKAAGGRDIQVLMDKLCRVVIGLGVQMGRGAPKMKPQVLSGSLGYEEATLRQGQREGAGLRFGTQCLDHLGLSAGL